MPQNRQNSRISGAWFVWLLAAILTGGCAKTYYVKQGASVADFEQDKEDCATHASMAAGYGTFRPSDQIANAIVYGPNLMDQCLRGRGWRKATQAEMEQIEKVKYQTTQQETKRSSEQSEVEYYEEMAIKGDAKAQLSLGWLYARGQGVEQDYSKARQWYEKSAAQSNAKAQYFLGQFYGNGQGVPQDYVQAHMWSNLAAGNGYEEATRYRDDLAKQMTATQIAEAQKLAREWKPVNK